MSPPMGGGGGNWADRIYAQQSAAANDPMGGFSNAADVYHWLEMGGRPGYDPTHLYLNQNPSLKNAMGGGNAARQGRGQAVQDMMSRSPMF